MIDRKDVVDILNGDGIIDTNRETSKYENVSRYKLRRFKKRFRNGFPTARIAYNDVFGGVVLQQQRVKETENICILTLMRIG